jgi:hypothetical protein
VAVLGVFMVPLAIFATTGMGKPKWELDGDKAVLTALENLENENKEDMK